MMVKPYPFFNLEQQAAYIEEAHQKGIKVKLYDTIRELTYKAYELFALRSLGDEIFNDGEGGGHSWLQEHLEDHYHAAWHAWRVDDAAILDQGTSRWTNYYIEGIRWLAANQHIDGLYLDDIAFSRETVKRLAAVLHENRPEVVIDLHSANQFNVRDGFINSAMLYMEHFPYITRLWFGEYFGELSKLGHLVSRSTVRRILIDLSSRRVEIAGIAPVPNGPGGAEPDRRRQRLVVQVPTPFDAAASLVDLRIVDDVYTLYGSNPAIPRRRSPRAPPNPRAQAGSDAVGPGA